MLINDFLKLNLFMRFVRVFVYYKDGKMMVLLVGFDKLSFVIFFVEVNVFIFLLGGMRGYEVGMMVYVFFIWDENGSEWLWLIFF